MSDIVEMLRGEPHRVPSGLALEAATEIERLRAALREIADAYAETLDDDNAVWMREEARRALGRK